LPQLPDGGGGVVAGGGVMLVSGAGAGAGAAAGAFAGAALELVWLQAPSASVLHRIAVAATAERVRIMINSGEKGTRALSRDGKTPRARRPFQIPGS